MNGALPGKVTVLGSGAGALACSFELAQHGSRVTLADLPEFGTAVQAVAGTGQVTLKAPWHGLVTAPVAATSTDPANAVAGADLVVVCVPAFGHDTFAELLAPVLLDGQRVLWVGEGGGSLVLVDALRRAGRRPDVQIGETNSLPYGARVRGPGVVSASRKAGGTLVASLGADGDLVDMAQAIWSWMSPAESVWETVLLNFNAIDHVPPIICNLGTVESRNGKMLLWGEGASPGVARIIETLDAELFTLRQALGVRNTKRYADYLVEQGFAPPGTPSFYELLRASSFADSTFQCGPDALSSRYITEDVPYALVLFSSIGREVGVATPTVDSLIHLTSIAVQRDLFAEGRTLDQFGLAGRGRAGLMTAVREGWW
ncbi:NAD/NADP octopine/nopaline dehydrogenase family protein [Phytoactinopolyspora limicola]|uniref:NAD/NADP octopine/nopaline dehydrogenase family protein n=1 Tax=Phytoactinopolyspora limicola TaxID=2715536 RepID=UPI0014083E7F|nr:NAD/NADP octopine/nopaline dehydrogenase family protein [Phytoactinopolyspora limicola]